jgi:hypothetical protein
MTTDMDTVTAERKMAIHIATTPFRTPRKVTLTATITALTSIQHGL